MYYVHYSVIGAEGEELHKEVEVMLNKDERITIFPLV